jgi:hypothetical protein
VGGVLLIEMGYQGNSPFGGPRSSLTSQPSSSVVIVVAAVDGDDGVHHHRQMSWHVQWILLTCHVITTTWG